MFFKNKQILMMMSFSISYNVFNTIRYFQLAPIYHILHIGGNFGHIWHDRLVHYFLRYFRFILIQTSQVTVTCCTFSSVILSGSPPPASTLSFMASLMTTLRQSWVSSNQVIFTNRINHNMIILKNIAARMASLFRKKSEDIQLSPTSRLAVLSNFRKKQT